jgi:hypothetical protein
MSAVRWLFTFVVAALSQAAPAQAPFSNTGVAFLERHCVACHGKDKQKADLTLHQYRDEASLLKSRKKWKHILEAVQNAEMPPDDKPQPTADERKAFLESARAVFVNFDKNAKPDPGRVTLRRLNRAEYNNTVKDLIGMDLQPANDFPSDDVGHGFDHIGDVLTVSPVLMEQFLDAAQEIAEQAIPLEPIKPTARGQGGKYLEPASKNVPMRGKFRFFTPGKSPVESGPLHTPFPAEPTGSYTLKARVYAESPDGKPVKVSLLVSGSKLANPDAEATLALAGADKLPQTKRAKLLKVVEVTARDEKQAQTIEVTLPPTVGVERLGLAIVREPGTSENPTVFVQSLNSEGPLDTRTPFVRRWVPAPNAKPKPQLLREVVAMFLPRAWRRPTTPDEVERIARLGDAVLQRGEPVEAGLRQSLIAILSSPKFLFRMELDDFPEHLDPHPINEFQLATRLSYFLWATCPDDQLLALAQNRQLTANLDAQVRRMLKDPRAETLVDNFAMQWLQLRRLTQHQADEGVFRRWRPTLKNSMLQETRLFLAEIVREDRSILDMIDADFTYVDRRLAEVYDLKSVGGFDGGDFKRVSLAGTPRGGLLTHASVLTVTSNPTRTSPVKRGKWILEQLLGDPPPPPPPNVPSLDDKNRKELSGSFRQKLEQHRADPACANCHAKMDTMGFAMENFNAIGQWRDQNEQGQPVEVGGKVSGLELKTLQDLKNLLKDRKTEFSRCVTEKMLIYALGRGLEYYDERTVDRIQAQLAQGNYKFSALVSAIVKSDPFRLRRGKTQLD